jgi:GNAT superfamily N-acetyltransferase
MRASEFTNFNYKSEPYEGWNGDGIVIRAYDGKDEVGHVIFEPTEDDASQWYAIDVEVEEPYQRKGIATKMYDIAKKVAKQQGAIIVKSHTQTNAGRGLWQNKKVWEESNSANIVSAKQIWYYISKTHPKDQQGGGFLKSLVMLNPQYELKRVPLSSLHIPNDEDEGNDPYGRAMFVDVYHAEEYSQYEVDKKPLVVDSQGYILDGAHRAWAASELLNKKDIMAYVPVKNRTSTPQDLEIRKKFTNQNVSETFDQPYKGKWEKSDYGDVDLNTKLPDGTNLSIMFNNQQGEEVVQVEFYRNNSQEVTGEGDAQRIFATVLDAIQKYIKKYKPQRLSFSASKATDPTIYYEPDQPQPNPESRAKLYDRLVQRYSKALGYRAFRADNGDIVIYELSRIKQGMAEGSNAGDIELSHSMSPDMLYVHATSDGTDVGGARFKKIDGAWTGDIVHVYPQFRRQGIATKIYDYAEDLVGKIIPSKTLKPKGKKFWDNRDNQGVAEGSENNIPTIGINVRSDGNIDYASLIVDGEKKYESRKTDSLRPYVGKTVGIVRTGNGPAVAIGQVTIGEPIVVDAEKFNRLRKQHLVPQGSKFDIDSDGTKYLYPMIDPVRWDNEKLIKHKGIVSRKIEEDKSKDPITNAVIDFYQHVGKIHKDPIDDYVGTAKEMLGHVSDPTLKSKLVSIFRQAKENPYIQGGVVTTIGALLAGGVLSSAQKMGLNPSQTNLALQAILNTVIPTVVSRINGKSWADTAKYTLASAGIGTGIAGIMDEERGLAPTKPYDDLMANMGYFMSLNTVKIQQDAVDNDAQQALADMQQQFRKPILNGMSFFDVNRDLKMSKNPKVAPILLKYVYDMLGYIEPRIKKYIKPEQQGKYLDRLDQIKNDYRGAVAQVS